MGVNLVAHRIEKLLPARAVGFSRPAWRLRERVAHNHSAKSTKSQVSTIPKHKFANGSDGFAGSELNIQHLVSQHRPRVSNRYLAKEKQQSQRNKSKLALVSGCLPSPLVEHENKGVVTAGSRLYTAGSWAVVDICADKAQLLSLRGNVNITTVAKNEEACPVSDATTRELVSQSSVQCDCNQHTYIRGRELKPR